MHNGVVFEIGEIKTAVCRFEHSVGRRCLSDVFYFGSEIFLTEVFVGKISSLDSVQRVSCERVIIQITVLQIERDTVGCNLRWRLFLFVDQLLAVDHEPEILFWLR